MMDILSKFEGRIVGMSGIIKDEGSYQKAVGWVRTNIDLPPPDRRGMALPTS